jgi:sugar lactone lactonase YvrE
MPTIAATALTPKIAVHGEGPCWDARTSEVLWVDMMAGRFLRTDLDSGGTCAVDVDAPVCAVVRPRAEREGWVVAREHDVCWLTRPSTPPTVIARLGQEPGCRLNEGTCDPQGRLLVGGLAYDGSVGRSSLWRVAGDGSATVVLPKVTTSNGIAFAADGQTVFYVDSHERTIRRFAVTDEDAFVELGVFAEVEEAAGWPDGIALDEEGGVWVALWEGAGVRRYAPNGSLDAVVKLPCPNATACAFVGDDGDLLAITTSCDRRPTGDAGGRLFVCEPGVAGLALHPFAG